MYDVIVVGAGTAGIPCAFEASRPNSTGDGITMSREIGAAIAGEGTYLPTFGGLPSPDGSGQVRWTDRPFLIAAERRARLGAGSDQGLSASHLSTRYRIMQPP